MSFSNFGAEAEPEVMIDMNATPLIDVMMVLLIMLIITIPAQLHSVNLDMPVQTTQPKKSDPVVWKVAVNAAGEVLINGVVMSGRAELEQRLQEASVADPQPEIHIRSDPKARYAVVAGVMASAQRNGLKKLGIVGTEQFTN